MRINTVYSTVSPPSHIIIIIMQREKFETDVLERCVCVCVSSSSFAHKK
jgi:hypothetical protein